MTAAWSSLWSELWGSDAPVVVPPIIPPTVSDVPLVGVEEYPVMPGLPHVPGTDVPRVDVYSHAFALQGQVARPLSVVVTECFKAAGTAVVSIAAEQDAEIAAAFVDQGCRVVVTLRDTVIFSGSRLPGAPLHWVGPEAAPTVTATFVDDYTTLTGILAWPIPGSPLGSQTTARYTATGPLETVAKNLIAANAARLGLPITVETSQGRGATVTVNARMQPVSDYIQPLLDQYNKGLKIRQSGTGLVVSWVEPVAFSETLSEVGGQIVRGGWELEETSPSITRTIVGDSGDGATRAFVPYVDTTAETATGWKLETFTDNSSTTVTAELTAAGQTAVAAGSAKISARIPLQETIEFRCYGTDGLKCGDLVPIDLIGRSWTDTIRQITTTWDDSNGLLVEPVAGGLDNQATAVDARRIASLQRAVRALQAGR